MVKVRLAGGQIPVELVDSWLSQARTYTFLAEQVGPVSYSQHGFQHLLDGTCDIACTDRRIQPSEVARFGDQRLAGYRVAFYGYALYVHPDNPLDSIYAGHIPYLFTRRMTDWQELVGHEVPGLDGPINLYGPEKHTRGGMILMRQSGIWFAEPAWSPLESDAEIVRRVVSDPLALGFASIGFDHEARYVGLRMQRDAKPAFPSLDEIESEEYGLAKVIYIYFKTPTTRPSKQVLAYLFSDEGTDAIESTNVWPVAVDRAAVPITP